MSDTREQVASYFDIAADHLAGHYGIPEQAHAILDIGLLRNAARLLREPAVQPAGEVWKTLCVECGPNVAIDEEWCCVGCGRDACGQWLEDRRDSMEAGAPAPVQPDTLLARLDAETLARKFHEHYEWLAPLYNYETRVASAVPWDQVPQPNRDLMVATSAAVLAELSAHKEET